jgi:hypothetical protein
MKPEPDPSPKKSGPTHLSHLVTLAGSSLCNGKMYLELHEKRELSDVHSNTESLRPMPGR